MFTNNKHLVIAKMDSTENESEGIEISSYPTINLVKKTEENKQEIIEFKGDNKLESVLEFLKEHVR